MNLSIHPFSDPASSQISVTNVGFSFKKEPAYLYRWECIQQITAYRVRHADEFDGVNYYLQLHFADGARPTFKKSLDTFGTFNVLIDGLNKFLPCFVSEWQTLVDAAADGAATPLKNFFQLILPELKIGVEHVIIFSNPLLREINTK